MTDMTPEQIKAALEAGIISDSQAEAMRAKADINNPNASVIGNEDDMRFLRSFSDVFISLGLGLLSLGLLAITRVMGGGVLFLAAAIFMFLMAEYFGRKKRQHLPTLVSAMFFLWFTHLGAAGLVSKLGMGGDITAALLTTLAMVLFYFRVRLPFCVALIAISLLYLFYAILLRLAPGLVQGNLGIFVMLGGLITFVSALFYDLRDEHRTTRFADNAFWLHLISAPMIINGIALSMGIISMERLYTFKVPMIQGDAAWIIMVLVAIVAVIGLAINRRALLVSSLGYAAIAIFFLIKETNVDWMTGLPLTLLVLGAMVVLLGVAWHQARNRLIKILPNWKIFPPEYDPDYAKKR